jgi:hypothetical protein
MCIPGFYAVLAMAGLMVWRGLDPVAVGAFLAVGISAVGGMKVAGAWQENKGAAGNQQQQSTGG